MTTASGSRCNTSLVGKALGLLRLEGNGDGALRILAGQLSGPELLGADRGDPCRRGAGRRSLGGRRPPPARYAIAELPTVGRCIRADQANGLGGGGFRGERKPNEQFAHRADGETCSTPRSVPPPPSPLRWAVTVGQLCAGSHNCFNAGALTWAPHPQVRRRRRAALGRTGGTWSSRCCSSDLRRCQTTGGRRNELAMTDSLRRRHLHIRRLRTTVAGNGGPHMSATAASYQPITGLRGV
jgi:hypothetical protein